jgi:hypothetical protein
MVETLLDDPRRVDEAARGRLDKKRYDMGGLQMTRVDWKGVQLKRRRGVGGVEDATTEPTGCEAST